MICCFSISEINKTDLLEVIVANYSSPFDKLRVTTAPKKHPKFTNKNHPLPLHVMPDEIKNIETGLSETSLEDNNDELYERFSLVIDKGQEPLRIDKFLMGRIEGATRNKLQQAINTGLVLVNGKEIRPNYKIKPLDSVIIYSDMSPEQTDVVPE